MEDYYLFKFFLLIVKVSLLISKYKESNNNTNFNHLKNRVVEITREKDA
jgi:hypothetical protein